MDACKINELKERIVAQDARIAAQEERLEALKLDGRGMIASLAQDRLRHMRDIGTLMRERLDMMETWGAKG